VEVHPLAHRTTVDGRLMSNGRRGTWLPATGAAGGTRDRISEHARSARVSVTGPVGTTASKVSRAGRVRHQLL